MNEIEILEEINQLSANQMGVVLTGISKIFSDIPDDEDYVSLNTSLYIKKAADHWSKRTSFFEFNNR